MELAQKDLRHTKATVTQMRQTYIYIYNLYRDRTISISYVKGWLVWNICCVNYACTFYLDFGFALAIDDCRWKGPSVLRQSHFLMNALRGWGIGVQRCMKAFWIFEKHSRYLSDIYKNVQIWGSAILSLVYPERSRLRDSFFSGSACQKKSAIFRYTRKNVPL